MGDENNYYNNPQFHDPLASTIDIQTKERAWYVPPPPETDNFPKPNTESAPIYGGYGGGAMPVGDGIALGGRSLGGDFLLNAILIGFLWEVWICLYPISAFAGLEALLWSMPFLRGVMPTSSFFAPGLYAVAGAFVIAAIVLWNASRFEHVLARHIWYRIPRHIVRLALLGVAATLAIQKYQRMPYNPLPAGLMLALSNPVNLAIVGATVIASHFILWNWTWARNFWHSRLEGARLRKREA